MDVKTDELLAAQASQYRENRILKSRDRRHVTPILPIEVQEQNTFFLALKSGDEMVRGIWTGSLGGIGALTGFYITWRAYSLGDPEAALLVFLGSLAMVAVPFLWEVLTPMAPPIIFNRRTREVYFRNNGLLYHTPWDEVGAVAYEYQMVHQNVGAMINAPLEVLMHRYRQPEDRIFVALGLPMGKTLELQEQVWSYLQAYMDRGPWLNEHGENTESPHYVSEQLVANRHGRRDDIKLAWNNWQETRSVGRAFQLFVYIGRAHV